VGGEVVMVRNGIILGYTIVEMLNFYCNIYHVQ
jgi:hypothetical protein